MYIAGVLMVIISLSYAIASYTNIEGKTIATIASKATWFPPQIQPTSKETEKTPTTIKAFTEKRARELFRIGEKNLEVTATAYYKPLPNQKRFLMGSYEAEVEMNGRGVATFVGNPPLVGSVAVDPTVIPFGTPMEIPGYGLGIAEDTGRAIKGNKIDLFMGEGDEGLQKCLDWGSRNILINIRRVS